MTGIQFVTDDKGRKTAVLIHLRSTRACGRISAMASYPSHAARKRASLTRSTGLAV